MDFLRYSLQIHRPQCLRLGSSLLATFVFFIAPIIGTILTCLRNFSLVLSLAPFLPRPPLEMASPISTIDCGVMFAGSEGSYQP